MDDGPEANVWEELMRHHVIVSELLGFFHDCFMGIVA